jgi:uncharacterized phiE125 gp8 family phage protein
MDPYSAPSQPRVNPFPLGDLELVTAPVGQVVTTAEAKLWLRRDDDEDNDVIDALEAAAVKLVEQEIAGHRQLLLATWDVPVAGWWSGPLRLPRPPLSSVTWVKYYDSAGTLQTLATTEYLVRTPLRAPGTVERAPLKSWPALQSDRRLPVTIRFVAGYGAASAVPATIKTAVKLLVAHWYEHREAVGQFGGPLELAVRALLESEGYGSYK